MLRPDLRLIGLASLTLFLSSVVAAPPSSRPAPAGTPAATAPVSPRPSPARPGLTAPASPATTAPGPALTAVSVQRPADVDRYFQALWAARGATVASTAPPEIWLRRAWLDLVGTIPSRTALDRFTADRTPGARQRVVDSLVRSPSFGRHWGRQLARTLLLPGEEWSDETGRNLERFLGDEINADRPWPRILHSLVTGSGRASAFRAQFREAPMEVAGAIGRGMLGIRLGCAQCHDDQVHGWTVDDFYGLAGFFGVPRHISAPRKLLEAFRAGKVRTLYDLVMNMPEMTPRGVDHRWVRAEVDRTVELLDRLHRMGVGPVGAPNVKGVDWAASDIYRLHRERRAMMNPRSPGVFAATGSIPLPGEEESVSVPSYVKCSRPGGARPGQRAVARFPGEPRPASTKGGKREALARWLSGPENPFVGRAVVNRVFSMLLGTPLVEPVDEVAHPVDRVHEPLLAGLTEGFGRENSSVRWLVRATVLSTPYGLGGVAPTRLATAASLGALDGPPAGASQGQTSATTDPEVSSASSVDHTTATTGRGEAVASFYFADETMPCTRHLERPRSAAAARARLCVTASVRPLAPHQVVASLFAVTGRDQTARLGRGARDAVEQEDELTRVLAHQDRVTSVLASDIQGILDLAAEPEAAEGEDGRAAGFPPDPASMGSELAALLQDAPVLAACSACGCSPGSPSASRSSGSSRGCRRLRLAPGDPTRSRRGPTPCGRWSSPWSS
ncbi:MAG: DUF1549 domain-containing protein [Candidatus Riflebacteria bacterium]|nr:DUF1549 domain-containing protein [Candidatus Riflebacteria bacterium]